MGVSKKNLIALDCGNSSFRVVLGEYCDKIIKSKTVYRVTNEMHKVNGYCYWDTLRIFTELKKGIKKAIDIADGKIDSIGISTWGIDFSLYDKDGFSLNNPLSYRNQIGSYEYDSLSEEEKKNMFFSTGILCDKINSIYMLNGMKKRMPTIVDTADKLLMIPDLLNYMFTGVMKLEKSEFSTTQLLNSRTKQIDESMVNKYGIDKSLFPELVSHGELIGNIQEDIKKEFDIDYDIPVICVAGHDTASAVTAVPAIEEDFIFISSGTWSLIGTELIEPIITDEVYDGNFTNEVGAFDLITLLKNSMGLFLIQEVKKEFEQELGKELSWENVKAYAVTHEEDVPIFDVNDRRLFNPKHMSKTVWEMNGGEGAINYPMIIKSIYNSLAFSYKTTIEYLVKFTNKEFSRIYVVGGGSKNEYLNQLTADATNMKVIACSPESTALGNLGIQLKYFDNEIKLKDIRNIISNSIKTTTFSPN